jgi:AhpD family alkylhydroperoxidase
MPNDMFPQATTTLAAARKELAPEIHEAFENFSERVFAEGALPSKTKQLIAVAVAHVTQCPYCIRGHTKAAVRSGATAHEIMEAIWVAAEMRAGAAYANAILAVDTIAVAEDGCTSSSAGAHAVTRNTGLGLQALQRWENEGGASSTTPGSIAETLDDLETAATSRTASWSSARIYGVAHSDVPAAERAARASAADAGGQPRHHRGGSRRQSGRGGRGGFHRPGGRGPLSATAD